MLKTLLSASTITPSAVKSVVVENDKLNVEVSDNGNIIESGNHKSLIDQKGKIMPLSAEFTARVLLVHGLVQESNLGPIYALLKVIDSDSFLKL